MGTWGPGIFASDLAREVLDAYHDGLAAGKDGSEVTDQLLAQASPTILSDPDEAPIFWLALAAAQVSLHRLEERVREKALDVIDAGADTARWLADAPGLLPERQAALLRLREDLVSPGRSPAEIRPRRPLTSRFVPGDVVAYSLDGGRRAIALVVGIDASHGEDRLPVVAVYRWIGTAAPQLPLIVSLPLITQEGKRKGESRSRPVLFAVLPQRGDGKRLELLGRVPFTDVNPTWHDVWYANWATIGTEVQRLLQQRPP